MLLPVQSHPTLAQPHDRHKFDRHSSLISSDVQLGLAYLLYDQPQLNCLCSDNVGYDKSHVKHNQLAVESRHLIVIHHCIINQAPDQLTNLPMLSPDIQAAYLVENHR